jgi:hypothetical protein
MKQLANDTRRFSWESVSVLMLVGVIAFYRKPDAFFNPQFWAEDGVIFFLQERTKGVSALFEPYGGYLHLVPRCVALIAGAFDPLWIPSIYNASAFLCLLLTAGFCLYCRIDDVNRTCLALALVCIPHSGEVFLNLTNAQWILAIILPLLIVQRMPTTKMSAFIDIAALVIVGLTGPFLLLFSVLFLLRPVMFGVTRYNIMCVGVAFLVAGIQGYFVLHGSHQETSVSSDIMNWLRAVGYHFPSGLLFGIQMPQYPKHFVVIGTLSLVAVVLYTALRLPVHLRLPAYIFLACGIIVYTAALHKFAHDPSMINPFAQGRYFYLPYLFLSGYFVVLLGGEPCSRSMASVALILILLSAATFFPSTPLQDFDWPTYAAKIRAGEAVVRIPINPPGWFLQVESNAIGTKGLATRKVRDE